MVAEHIFQVLPFPAFSTPYEIANRFPFSHLFDAVVSMLDSSHHMSACLPIVLSRQLCCGRSLQKISAWNSKGIGFHGIIALYFGVCSLTSFVSYTISSVSPSFIPSADPREVDVGGRWGRSYPPFSSSSPLSWWTSSFDPSFFLPMSLRHTPFETYAALFFCRLTQSNSTLVFNTMISTYFKSKMDWISDIKNSWFIFPFSGSPFRTKKMAYGRKASIYSTAWKQVSQSSTFYFQFQFVVMETARFSFSWSPPPPHPTPQIKKLKKLNTDSWFRRKGHCFLQLRFSSFSQWFFPINSFSALHFIYTALRCLILGQRYQEAIGTDPHHFLYRHQRYIWIHSNSEPI